MEGHEDGRPPLRLYFDTQTGLLLRLVRYSHSPLGSNPIQIDYADYREVDGVKVPLRWTVSRPGNRYTIQVREMKRHAPVDNSKFTLPRHHLRNSRDRPQAKSRSEKITAWTLEPRKDQRQSRGSYKRQRPNEIQIEPSFAQNGDAQLFED